MDRLDIARFLFLLGLVLAAGLPATPAQAQNALVRGFVTDGGSGVALQGVNILLQEIDGDAFHGGATNSDGFYAISGVEPGTYRLQASFISYMTYRDTLTLDADEVVTRTFELREQDVQLDELVVEGERETAGAASVAAGLQTIEPEDIELVPTPDVSADLAGYITTLPGVVSTGDRGGQLFIRGGEPSQNLVTIDGLTLYQPFHIVGFYSAFPSYIVNSVDLYAGGYGAKYGGRLSSVLDIDARPGNMRSYAGAVSVAPFVSGVRLEGPIWRDKVSVLASYRRSVIEEGAAQIIDQPLPYQFSDRFVKLQAHLSGSSRLSVMHLRTFDRGSLVAQADRPGEIEARGENVEWVNEATGARFIILPSELPISVEAVIGMSSYENRFGERNDPTRSSSLSEYKVAGNVTHYTPIVNFQWGFFLRTYELASDLGGRYQNFQTEREYVTEAGLYFQPEFSTGGLEITPGLRIQTFPSKSRTFLEPRIRALWHLNEVHRLSAAAGIYHQEIVGLTDRRDAGNVFTAWTSSPLGQVPQAMHAILGYQIEPSDWLSLSVESYYKRLSNLFVSRWSALPQFTTTLQPADGDVYGFDLRAEFVREPFYASLSYGHSKTTYYARGENIDIWYGTPSRDYHPAHDRRHQVNALGSVDFWGAQLSIRWQFGSGLPYTQSAGFDDFVFIDGPTDLFEEAGQTRVIYAEPYEARLIDYHRMDVSLERTFDISANIHATLQASLINGYDRANLFYLDLYTLQRVNQLPFVPSIGVKVAFD